MPSRNLLGQFQVRQLVSAADVVDATRLPLVQNRHDRPDEVLDMEPLTSMRPVPVDGDGLALQGGQSEGRDRLLRVLPRANAFVPRTTVTGVPYVTQ